MSSIVATSYEYQRPDGQSCPAPALIGSGRRSQKSGRGRKQRGRPSSGARAMRSTPGEKMLLSIVPGLLDEGLLGSRTLQRRRLGQNRPN